MVVGAVTLTNLGTYDTSGAALKVKVDAQNLKTLGYLSGGRLIYVPMANGRQVQVLAQSVAVA